MGRGVKTESDKFVVDAVRWAYTESQEITGDRMPREPFRTHVASANVTCKTCSYSWRGYDGDALAAVIGGTRITCPNCGAQEGLKIVVT